MQKTREPLYNKGSRFFCKLKLVGATRLELAASITPISRWISHMIPYNPTMSYSRQIQALRQQDSLQELQSKKLEIN